MTRDMDLFRTILLAVEEAPTGELWSARPLLGYAIDDVVAHIRLIDDAGLVEARFSCGPDAVILRLTNAGYDFLEASRPATRWEQAKKIVADRGLPVTIDVVRSVLDLSIKAALSHISV